MADLLIEASAHDALDAVFTSGHSVYDASPTVRYEFFVNFSRNFMYRKITSGSVGAAQLIKTGIIEAACIYAVEWTTGDKTDTEIHLFYGDRTDGAGVSKVFYNRLDTSDDSLSGEITLRSDATFTVSGSPSSKCFSGGQTLSGNVLLAWRGDSAGSHGLERALAADLTTWDSQTTPFVADDDVLRFVPGNVSGGDPDDCWFIYDDKSANSLLLREYDDSGAAGEGSYSDTTIDSDFTTSTAVINFSVVHRQSDDHALVTMWSEADTATADLRFYDITNSTTISSVVTVMANQAEAVECVLFINQQNGQLYVSIIEGGTFFSAEDISYLGSDDAGATWTDPVQTQFSADAQDDHRSLYSAHSVGDNGGVFAPVWFNDDLNDILTNVDNEIPIPAATLGVVGSGLIDSNLLHSGPRLVA